jgi:hypothetical protein
MARPHCLACTFLAIVRDELLITIPKEQQFGEDLHRLFVRLQQRRDTGDQSGTVEEGEVIGMGIHAAATDAGLDEAQLKGIADRFRNPVDDGPVADRLRQVYRFPEYHERD